MISRSCRCPAALRDAPSGAGGFALAVVVFLLFAIAMASAIGYAVVSLDAEMAIQSEERAEAARIARAGLERYFGEHLGIPDDTVTYAIGGGDAVLTARRIAVVDSADGIHLYLVESEGRVSELPGAASPARVRVRQYARLHAEPIARTGALIASYANLNLRGEIVVDGEDDFGGSCPIAGEESFGVAHRGSLTTSCKSGFCPDLDGDPAIGVNLGSHTAVFDTAGLRWDILTDPNFPVDHSVSSAADLPNFWALPPDEYPVIRVPGNLAVDSNWNGRGVLIVPGTLSIPWCCFTWDGVVLAGELASSASTVAWAQIRGQLIGGLNGGGANLTWDNYVGPRIYLDACHALGGSQALAYFEPIEGTFREAG